MDCSEYSDNGVFHCFLPEETSHLQAGSLTSTFILLNFYSMPLKNPMATDDLEDLRH
jgi:hypothetical protein